MKRTFLVLVLQILISACGQPPPTVAPEAPTVSASAPASIDRAMPKMMADAQGGAEQSLTERSEEASCRERV